MQTIGTPQPVATLDGYNNSLTLEQDTADTLAFVVANASVICKLRPVVPPGTAEAPYGPEILLPPQTNVFKKVSGAAFKSAIAGTPARIVAQLLGPDDPQIAGGIPFTQTLSAGGSTTQILVLPRVAMADFPPTSPSPDMEIALSVDATHAWHMIYNATTGYWEFLGGPAIILSVDPNAACNTLTQVGATNCWYQPGTMSYTTPRPGDWQIEGFAQIDPNADGNIRGSACFAANALGPAGRFDEYPIAGAAAGQFQLHEAHDELPAVPTATQLGYAILGGAGGVKIRRTVTTIRPKRLQ